MANTNAALQLIEKIESFYPNETDMPTMQDLKNPTSAMVYKFLGRALYEFSIDIDTLKMVCINKGQGDSPSLFKQ